MRVEGEVDEHQSRTLASTRREEGTDVFVEWRSPLIMIRQTEIGWRHGVDKEKLVSYSRTQPIRYQRCQSPRE